MGDGHNKEECGTGGREQQPAINVVRDRREREIKGGGFIFLFFSWVGLTSNESKLDRGLILEPHG